MRTRGNLSRRVLAFDYYNGLQTDEKFDLPNLCWNATPVPNRVQG